MCRLLGITNFDFNRHEGLLESFLALARRGKTLAGDPPGHLDGWGIGYYRNGEAAVKKSGGSLLDEKDEFFETLEKLGRSGVLLVHLRKAAWAKTSTAAHAHPFHQGRYLFAHNGTIRDYKKLLDELPPEKQGALRAAFDTEVYFHYVLRFLGEGGIEPAFREAADRIRAHNTYSSLTCVFSDGEKLFAYREFSKYPEYYTLLQARGGGSAFVSSEALAPAEGWAPIVKGKLFIA